jgi:DUF4097 and DUF4098 domain-containing protein YvlB
MRLPLFAIACLLLSTGAAAEDCKHHAERNLDIDAAGLKSLAIESGSTDITVRGVAGLARIEVRGKACASTPELLERLRVVERRDGDRLVVRAEREGGSWSLFGSVYSSLELEVRMPSTLALAVEAGSGDGVIEDVASLDWKSGSADLEVRNVAGAVRSSMGSGDVQARAVGPLTLSSTGSGDLEADGVRGDVEVGSGGSGDLTFRRVDGNVRIGDIGSGDVDLRDIIGSVVVDSTGSGDVTVDGVRGDLTVRSQGSGDTSHRNVAGKVDVPSDD